MSEASPTAAEIIRADLARLADDEWHLVRIVDACAGLGGACLHSTQATAVIHQGQAQRELDLVRAAIRHLQHQARVEAAGTGYVAREVTT
jgi:hypothetical protein